MKKLIATTIACLSLSTTYADTYFSQSTIDLGHVGLEQDYGDGYRLKADIGLSDSNSFHFSRLHINGLGNGLDMKTVGLGLRKEIAKEWLISGVLNYAEADDQNGYQLNVGVDYKPSSNFTLYGDFDKYSIKSFKANETTLGARFDFVSGFGLFAEYNFYKILDNTDDLFNIGAAEDDFNGFTAGVTLSF